MREVEPLAGASASALMARGFGLELLGFLCIVPIVFESYLPGPWLAWGGTFLGLALILVAAGVGVTLRSSARSKLERAAAHRPRAETLVLQVRPEPIEELLDAVHALGSTRSATVGPPARARPCQARA